MAAAASRSQTTSSSTSTQNRIRTGSFRRCGILVANEVAIDGARATGCGTPVARDSSLLAATKRLLNTKDSSSPSSSKTILPDRSTRLIAAGRLSPVVTPSHRRDDEWNGETKRSRELLLDPERRNRPDTNDRRPSVTKAAIQRRCGPTNPIAVVAAAATAAAGHQQKTVASSSSCSSSRIPRLNNNNNNITQHRVAANNRLVSPDSSSGTMDSTNDSSLDLSQIGRNRSNTASSSSQQSSTSSLILGANNKPPSRLLPPGSIVSAKLAAHQVGCRPGHRSVTSTPVATSVHQRQTIIKSKLPVATTTVSKRPDCRSTRSLPDGSVRTTKVTTSAVSIRSAQLNHLVNGPTAAPAAAGRIPKNVRPVPTAAKSVQQQRTTIAHKTPTLLHADRGSVSKKKASTAAAAAGLKVKKEEQVVMVEDGGMECRPVSAGGGGEICRGSQGRQEGSLSADPRITPPPPLPPPPPPAPLPAGIPDEVDRHHLGNDDSMLQLSQSANSLEETLTCSSAVAAAPLFSSSSATGLFSTTTKFLCHQQLDSSNLASNGTCLSKTKTQSVIRCHSDSMAARPVSVHESSTTSSSLLSEWTVRISIPAAESSELLTRLECERQSIRGSTRYLTASPVAADVELMELLERDLLLTAANDDDDEEQQQQQQQQQQQHEEEKEEEPTPANDDESVENNPQRSLSLPKSFLATKYGLIGLKAALPSVRFPWRRTEGNRVTTSHQSAAAASHHHPETAGSSGTFAVPAPHTSLPPTGPSSSATSSSALTAAARRPPGSASTTRTARRFKSTSSPVFIDDDDRVNRSHSAWDLASRPWSHFGEMSVSGSHTELADTTSVASISEVQTEVSGRESAASPTSNNSTLRKFRKSFSLRLSRRPSQDDTNNEEEQDGENSLEQQQTSPKFRFGPLVWRASRERNNKKSATNKAARNAKCNSGDSGVQMETTSSSQTMDETQTDAIVRRTQSDLGGEAVIVAALRSSTGQNWSQALAIPESAKNRSRKLTRSLAKAHLRRSASQPVVVLPGGGGGGGSGIRTADGPSDDDAGLCLSEDDNLSDCGGNNHLQAENEAVRYSAATEGVLAIALWDHNAVEQEELSLQSGDVVHILDLSDPNWWWAARGQQYGWLPASYVQLCEQPFHRKQGLAQGQKFARTLTPAGMAALQHSVRANVINELVTAERDYVKLLSDLVDGYLKPMKSRPDLFTPQRIQSIFGNLEELYRFQKSFLVDLEHSLNWNALEDSVVGGCFLQHIQEFAIYATYCNNQDRAAAEMQLLCDDMRYLRFFEACRLLRRMIRLPLEAFLLSPVQKICKYPLQLAELLKHTPDEHPDRRLVSLALDSMRSVAYLVNESKRRAEMQQFLVQWQTGVDHWLGSDITTFNSRLVHQGELFKISSNGWTREVTLFLFDKELVICKKELIKRSSLVYKDRLTVEDIEVLEPLAVVDVRPHSFQLRSFSRAKAYLLACRSAQDKNQWVSAIQHLQQHNSSDWPIFPAPTMTFGRQKMSSKRSKVKHNPALILTLEEAHLTLEGRDLPTIKRKS